MSYEPANRSCPLPVVPFRPKNARCRARPPARPPAVRLQTGNSSPKPTGRRYADIMMWNAARLVQSFGLEHFVTVVANRRTARQGVVNRVQSPQPHVEHEFQRLELVLP